MRGRKRRLIAVLMAAFLGFSMPAAAAKLSIAIDFIGGSESYNGGAVNAMQPGEAAGVVPQSFWNSTGAGGQANTTTNRSGTLAPGSLRDSTGATVPAAGLTWNGWATFSTTVADTPGNNRMMKGYLDAGPSGQTTTLTLTGLPEPYTSGGYDLLVYFDGLHTLGSQDRIGRYRVYGGTSIAAPLLGEVFGRDPVNVNFSGTFIEAAGTTAGNATAGNYVRIAGLHAGTFTIEALGAGGDVPRAPINGIQVVASVPEPGTIALLAAGAAGVAAWMLRRQRSREA